MNRKVSQTDFFKAIGNLDCHPSIVGPWPYTSIFKLRYERREVGKIVQTIPAGSGLPVSEYFLP